MRIDVVTIFPDYFGPLDVSLLGKARTAGLIDVRVHDLREHTDDPHRSVDDAPFGGGPGMVMKPDPWYRALEDITSATEERGRPHIVFPSPSGRPFNHVLAAELAARPWLVIGCGRYEGIDQRVVDEWVDDEISVGDYVLAGGEAAALVIIEAVTRLVSGVVGNAESVADDSFAAGALEGPVYTRPASYRGREVPEVLLSGDHAAIAQWRRLQGLRRTAERRPDLLRDAPLSPGEPAVAD